MGMASWTLLLLAIVAAANLIPSSSAQCSRLTLSDSKVYSLCQTLPYLGSSLHWTYHPSNITVDLAFRANVNPPAWIAWGVNPSAPRMVGTQALVAVVSASGNVTAYPSPIPSYSPSVQRGNLSITVFHVSATYSAGITTIFATISLPNNSTLVNHVWQSSSSLSGDVPRGHPTAGDNILSRATLNFLYGESVPAPTYSHLKNVHGILCTVGWGILAPLGMIILSAFPSVKGIWFRVPIAIYWSAYLIGSVGWVIGIALGNESVGIEHGTHRSIGIAIFVIATLYVGDLRPGKCFNPIGWTVLILSIVNIFKGFHILGGLESLRAAFIAVITTLGVAQVVAWILVVKVLASIVRE